MKRCPYCGEEYDDSATACATDGHPLAEVIPQPPPTQDDCSAVLPAEPQGMFFPLRIGRGSFVVRCVLCMLAVWLGAMLLTVGSAMQPGIAALAVLGFSVALLLFALFYFIRHILVARLRDVGLQILFGLLILVPVVNIGFLVFLAVAPKGGFKNRTGRDQG